MVDRKQLALQRIQEVAKVVEEAEDEETLVFVLRHLSALMEALSYRLKRVRLSR